MPRRSRAASNWGFFLPPVHSLEASRCERFDIFDHSSGHMFVRLVVTCFLVSLP